MSLLNAERSGIAVTAGFYKSGDGGGNTFLWDPSRPKTDHNGGTVIDPDTSITPGAPGWWTTTSTGGTGCWVCAKPGLVNAVTFGAKMDASEDAADALNAYAAWCGEEHRKMIIPPGKLLLAKTVHAPVYVEVKGAGQNTIIYADANGVFTNGYLFCYNSSDGITWDVAYPSIPLGGISGLSFGDFAHSAPADTKCIFAAGGCEIDHIRSVGYYGTITTSNNYNDFVQIGNISFYNHQGTDYPININNLGDGLTIHHVYASESGPNLSMRVFGSLGCKVEACLHGDILFDHCDGTTLTNCHFEKGRILVNCSNVTIKDTYFHPLTTERINITGNPSGSSSDVILDNVTFNRFNNDDPASYAHVDVVIDGYSRLVTRNCKARPMFMGYTGDVVYTGIVIGSDANTPLPDWQKYAAALSVNGIVAKGQKVIGEINFGPVDPTAQEIFSVVATAAQGTWGGADGTYYYRAVMLFDADRMVGAYSAEGEKNVAVTNGGNCVLFQFGTGPSYPVPAIIRIYRGTSAGSYDHYVDVPLISGHALYDTGDRVSSYTWQTRTAGGVDSLLESAGMSVLGGIAKVKADSAPAVGAWQVGDVIEAITPAAGGTYSYVCTTAGSPGTFKAFGSIAA